jgi:hypothetical protein
VTNETSLAKLTEQSRSRGIDGKYRSVDALRSELLEKNNYWENKYYQLLNSRSWKWTSFLRKLYGIIARGDTVLPSSLVLSFLSNLVSDFYHNFQFISKFVRYFLFSIFTINGVKARFLKVQVLMMGDFPIARKSVKKSRFINCTFLPTDVRLHITEDISFSRYTIFEFSRYWIKNKDNSTLYCDVVDVNQKNKFDKPNWNAVYNQSIKLFPPMYLESASFTSLNPKKIQAIVSRPLSKLGVVRNKELNLPVIPKISLASISRNKTPFSVVIPTANKRVVIGSNERWLIRDLIEDINKTQILQLPEIIVVHNELMSSTDQRTLLRYPNVQLVLCLQKSLNLSSKINLGVKAASYEKLIICNDDVRFKSSEWLDALLAWLELDSVGVVGPRIFYENGLLQYAGVDIDRGIIKIIGYRRSGDSLGLGFSYVVPREVSAVTGVLMATKKSIFVKIKGWDPKLKINYNDIDYCLRANSQGFKVIYEPRAEIFHLESSSRDLSVSHIPEENFFIERYKNLQSNWPALVFDSAVSPQLSFTWRQNYTS